jgi:hypothetical protein
VAKFITIKTIVAIRVRMDFEMHEIDVKITFLNIKLEENRHMEQISRIHSSRQTPSCLKGEKVIVWDETIMKSTVARH